MTIRHIPLVAISSVEIIDFRTVFDWRGLGSRYGSESKWTFFRLAKQGVLVKTRNGKEFIIDSSTPQKLNEAIVFFKK